MRKFVHLQSKLNRGKDDGRQTTMHDGPIGYGCRTGEYRGGFVVTVPLGATWSDVTKGLETLRPRLRETQARRSEKLIDLNYRIEAEHFKLTLVERDIRQFQARSELGMMQILCPRGTDFSNPTSSLAEEGDR